MQNIPFAFFVVLLAGSLPAHTQDSILAPKNPSDWKVHTGRATLSGDENMVIYKSAEAGLVELHSEKSLKIDAGKSYRLSGLFQRSSESGTATFYFGVLPYSEPEKSINAIQVNVVEGTETELAADCQVSDTTLIIKNGENWSPGPNGDIQCVAFKVDDSGNYSDLPNFDLSSIGILDVKKSGDTYEVTLAKACGKQYPAGTKIRKQSAGANAIYAASLNKNIPQEWTEFKGTIAPGSAFGNPSDKWWKGTQEAKIVIIVKGSGDSPLDFSFKDVQLQEE